MDLAVRPSSPALQPFIKSLHYHETAFPFGLERIMPSGGAHLMINLAEDQFRTYSGADCGHVHSTQGSALSGPHGHSTVLDTAEFQWLMAVEFRIGGAAPFFRLPLDEVSNHAVGLDHLWGTAGRLVREQLLEVPSPQAKLRLLESALLQHFSGPSKTGMAHAAFLLDRGLPVAAAATQLGFLSRTFTRRFRQHLGLTPKRFARVRRMQRVLRYLRKGGAPDWCEVAIAYGFTDQAHFIHDFRDLTGITPSAYKPHSPRRGNHVPIDIRPH